MRTKVSAFVDGALDETETETVLNALSSDAQLRRDWWMYCMIDDCLRGVAPLSPRFSETLMQRLESEPIVLAPPPARKTGHVKRWAMPIAASVVGVAVVAWLAQSMNVEQHAQIASAPPAPAVVERVAVAPEAAAPPANVQTAHDARQVEPYLYAHQGFSPSRGIQGVAQYVRVVSESKQDPAR